jgi:hypothetical protein
MTDLELESRLREVLVAAQARFRKQRGMGVIVTPIIPNPLIDQVAVGLAPVVRQLVVETVAALLPGLVEAAVAARLDAPGVHDLDAVIGEVS